MIPLKNKKQIEVMVEGGKRLASILGGIKKEARVGQSLSSLSFD